MSAPEPMKYIFVTGGVVSGLGKGITISSIGRLLKSSGFRTTCIKVDPYLNTDAGTMSPFEHGETFVLDDGGETDLDLGNYERFLDVMLTKDHNITTGKMYSTVIEKERRGDYLGKTVQVVPHVTDAIQEWIFTVGRKCVDGTGLKPDICLVEVGGTVGDIESMVFLEALRQFQFKVGKDCCCLVHVSLVPVLGSVGEQKTKPTQHGVKELMSLGLSPNMIVCRCEDKLLDSTRQKISAFCHVPAENVVSVHDVSNIYHVPIILQEQNVHTILRNILKLDNITHGSANPDLKMWKQMAISVDKAETSVNIAIVGKYTGLHDAYLSVLKALKHGSIACNKKLDIHWIESSDLEVDKNSTSKSKRAWSLLAMVDGILVPGGFGVRGIEGKIAAVKYARLNSIPLLGVCLGMQAIVIEYARNVVGLENANSFELDETTPHPVIVKMLEHHTGMMGGTMRLGARDTVLYPMNKKQDNPSHATLLYGNVEKVSERHRHRYEVNPEYIKQFETAGLNFTGKDDQGERMEICELSRSVHPFFFGAQYHPEFKSRPDRPSPPFHGFILAACGDYANHFNIMNGFEKKAAMPTSGAENKKNYLSSSAGTDVVSVAPLTKRYVTHEQNDADDDSENSDKPSEGVLPETPAE